MDEKAIQAGRAVQLFRRAAALRPDVAGPVYPRLRRRLELVVGVHPFWVVRSEHMGLDPELWKVGRELQRPRHAAAAGRRKVHRDDQQLHRR